MKRTLIVVAIAAVAAISAGAADKPGKAGKWVSMFNGKDLDGWKAGERPENWKVEEGTIVGRGDRSHLFWVKEECENCEFKATVKISDKGNSGMYFRAQFMEGWPKGYEAQVNSTHGDKVRTGSLYNLAKVYDQLVPPDTWFTQHVIADGNHIVIKVNDKTVVDFVDKDKSFTKGHLALQQHDPGSTVWYKDLQYRKLPSGK